MLQRTPRSLRALVDSDRFNLFIAGLIVANAITLGLSTYPGLANNPVLANLNNMFFALFLVELATRMAAYGKSFFRDGWNVFDFVVITAALIPGLSASAQALRLVRLARIVRLVRFLPEARTLIAGVVRALPPLGSLVVLTMLLLFVYGMLGWTLFGEQLPLAWGTVSDSMLTLFVLLTLENFPVYLDEAMAVSPWAVPFFLSYAMLAAFIIWNLLIGIIIGSLEEARERDPELCAYGELQHRIKDVRKALDALEADLKQDLF